MKSSRYRWVEFTSLLSSSPSDPAQEAEDAEVADDSRNRTRRGSGEGLEGLMRTHSNKAQHDTNLKLAKAKGKLTEEEVAILEAQVCDARIMDTVGEGWRCGVILCKRRSADESTFLT